MEINHDVQYLQHDHTGAQNTSAPAAPTALPEDGNAGTDAALALPDGLEKVLQEAVLGVEAAAAQVRADIPEREQLRRLNDSQLIQGLLAAQAAEKRFTLSVVLHLLEAERRNLHLREGYGSLFDYCTIKLGYSASAAVRRIRTARCIRDYPQVYWMLKKGELNLITVAQAAGTLNKNNAAEVLQRIRGKSQREVAGVVAEQNPKALVPERAAPICIRQLSKEGLRTYLHLIKLELAISHESYNKLEFLQILLARKFPEGASLAQVFELILEEYYDRHAPERKAVRSMLRLRRRRSEGRKPIRRLSHTRKVRLITAETTCNRSGCKNTAQQKGTSETRARETGQQARPDQAGRKLQEPAQESVQERSRYIPASVKAEVYARDNGCCTYVGKNGRRCSSRWDLQYDHVHGFARGAGNTAGELRLLCGKHNQLEAVRLYGEAKMHHYRRRE